MFRRKKLDTLKAIDWDLGYKLAGGKKELAKELLQSLIQTLPEEKEKINEAFTRLDFTALSEIVHRLHGACCYCGVPLLKSEAQKLEKASATHSIEGIKSNLQRLNAAIEELLAKNLDDVS
jgi:two-component system sensor histidine kinase BarA